MATRIVFETICDRCGGIHRGYEDGKGLPSGWTEVSMSGASTTKGPRELCSTCASRVAKILLTPDPIAGILPDGEA